MGHPILCGDKDVLRQVGDINERSQPDHPGRALEGSPKSLSRFVVIHWERQTWVFPADEVSAVIRHGRARETGAPSTLERWKSALVRTVVDWEGKKAGKIDPGELLARLVKHVG